MNGFSAVRMLLVVASLSGAVSSVWPQTGGASAANAAAPLAVVAVKSAGGERSSAYDGVVEAVRQTVVAAQVPGAVVALNVKAGDSVKAGQVLARLDARAAQQTAAAGDAQVRAAQAELEVATREVERQRQLFAKQYISRAALDRAEGQFKTTEAQVASQLAQAGASRTQSGFYVLTAPYNGVVAEVSVVLGDMAMPGRALMTLYDPAAMRVTAPVPQSAVARLAVAGAEKGVRVELPGQPGERAAQVPLRVTVLPAADPTTHTVPVRFDLAAGAGLLPGAGLTPGMFARVWLPGAGSGEARLFLPATSLVRRAELNAVYVLDSAGKPHLRMVRIGRSSAEGVEILAGVAAGDKVAADPQAAAGVR